MRLVWLFLLRRWLTLSHQWPWPWPWQWPVLKLRSGGVGVGGGLVHAPGAGRGPG